MSRRNAYFLVYQRDSQVSEQLFLIYSQWQEERSYGNTGMSKCYLVRYYVVFARAAVKGVKFADLQGAGPQMPQNLLLKVIMSLSELRDSGTRTCCYRRSRKWYIGSAFFVCKQKQSTDIFQILNLHIFICIPSVQHICHFPFYKSMAIMNLWLMPRDTRRLMSN